MDLIQCGYLNKKDNRINVLQKTPCLSGRTVRFRIERSTAVWLNLSGLSTETRQNEAPGRCGVGRAGGSDVAELAVQALHIGR